MNIKERIRKMGPFIALVVTFIVIAALNDSFVDPNNLKNLLRQVSINALISFGMTFVILTGGIDLSVGSLLALSSALMGSLIVSGMNPMLAILAACFIGMGLGAVNGLVIAYGKVAPFIATLATMTIYRGLTLVYTNGNPISGLSDDTMFHDFGQGFFMGLPVPAIIMLLAFAVSWFILRKTPLGRKIYAVGGNEKVSFIAGIKIERVKIFVYAITGFFCALAGAVLTSRLNSAQPTAGTGYELDAIAAVVLGGTSLSGGKGYITGTLVGVLIIGTLNNPFFVSVRKGVEEEAKKLGVNVKIVDAQNDPAKQANDISDLIQQKVDVLLINPVDSAAVSTSVAAANKASIPVLALDRSADKGTVASFIASDNVKGGEMAAEYIIQKLGEKVKVAELEGIPGASATRERGEGFHKVADQKLTVVAKQSADFDRSKGLTVAENMLQANPDIQAIFAQNDEMALGAIEAAKSANKKIFIVGFDGTQDGLKAVEAGTMAATIAQQPELMGQQGLDAAVKVAKGEKVEAKIGVPLKLVDKK